MYICRSKYPHSFYNDAVARIDEHHISNQAQNAQNTEDFVLERRDNQPYEQKPQNQPHMTYIL